MKYCSLLFFLLIGSSAWAQTVLSRQVIGATGSNSVALSDGTTVSQTVGEAVVGSTGSGTLGITQGFQQPALPLIAPAEINYFNAFSPNGDGDNDTWNIPDMLFYPNNRVRILNRWGDEVLEFVNYDNTSVVWDGNDADGNLMLPGTYFFIIEYGATSLDKSISGWVQMLY